MRTLLIGPRCPTPTRLYKYFKKHNHDPFHGRGNVHVVVLDEVDPVVLLVSFVVGVVLMISPSTTVLVLCEVDLDVLYNY